VQEVKRTKKNPSKYFQHQEELNMFFFANGKKKFSFFEFSFLIAQEKPTKVFPMPKAIWHVFLPKKKVQKTFELFFLQLPKKTYRGIFDTKSTSTCFSWAIAKRNLKEI
jgi:hypothetical protein